MTACARKWGKKRRGVTLLNKFRIAWHNGQKMRKAKFFWTKKTQEWKLLNPQLSKKNKTTESRFIQQIWWKKCEPVASFNSFSFIKIVEWKRKTTKKKKCLTWNSHDFETNLSKFWSGNKNWKKTFFDELLQQKQKQSRHKKVDLTFQKKFQNFLKNRSDFGVKKFIYFIYFYFSAQSRKRALLHLRWSRFSGQERKWWVRFLISWTRSYKKFQRNLLYKVT